MVRLAELFHRARRDDVEVLRARFMRFRHLIGQNDRVLQLMATAEEKLGGEYLFDAQYLQTLARELSEAVTSIVHDLAEISGNRYPSLLSALERIHAAAHSSLEPRRFAESAPWTLPLSEVGSELADVVGEKMARLGEIRNKLGASVPDGFVITARASQRVLDLPSVAEALEYHRQGQAASSEAMRAAIMDADPPSEVLASIKEALGRFRRKARFAVRSSALGEDGRLSFAGQHTTLLNVPRDRVIDAWLEVVASLFSRRAVEYRRRHGLAVAEGEMAVGCLLMVSATSSGVVYTLDPNAPQSGTLVVSVARGLGVSVVEGRHRPDRYRLTRQVPHRVLSHEASHQREMCVAAPEEGTTFVPVALELQQVPTISEIHLAALADIALRIERHMRCSQDIEWALDDQGQLFVLQARQLHMGPGTRPDAEALVAARTRHRILMQGCGEIACRGVGVGPVFVVRAEDQLDSFPSGGVLVSELASPRLSTLLSTASAVVCDAGSATGHLATLAREYRVPTLVGTTDATRRLTPDVVVTVDADDNTIFEGSVEELVRYQLLRSHPYQETPEFRALRRLLKHVSPLHLKDPSSGGFLPERCRTYHDIVRFAHERALVELGRLDKIRLFGRNASARTLELDIPIDLVVIDLGGGLTPGVRGNRVTLGQVASRPLTVVLEGMLTPRAWSMNPAEMDLEGFMASATRAGPLTVPGGGAVRHNVAIVSDDYLNLNLRVGYHFNIVDTYLGKNPEDSYIFFRFVGGVTDVTRRARRARLLGTILAHQEFKTDINGELIVARLQGIPPELCEERLRMVGRLIGFSRQLDILLRDDRTVDRLADSFLKGSNQPLLDDTARSDKMHTDVDVMVLDDELTVCERVKEFLEKNGMNVETFVDSTVAIERLAEKRFHVVVTDLKMRSPNGLDVLLEVKSRNLPTQVIVITGYRTFEDARAAEYVGAYAFLDKPFHLEELHSLVKKAARQARKQV